MEDLPKGTILKGGLFRKTEDGYECIGCGKKENIPDSSSLDRHFQKSPSQEAAAIRQGVVVDTTVAYMLSDPFFCPNSQCKAERKLRFRRESEPVLIGARCPHCGCFHQIKAEFISQ